MEPARTPAPATARRQRIEVTLGPRRRHHRLRRLRLSLQPTRLQRPCDIHLPGRRQGRLPRLLHHHPAAPRRRHRRNQRPLRLRHPSGTQTPVEKANPCASLAEVSGAASGAQVVAGPTALGYGRPSGDVTVSDDGSTAYFTAKGVLADNEDALGEKALLGDDNLYVWRTDAAHPDGQTTFVASRRRRSRGDPDHARRPLPAPPDRAPSSSPPTPTTPPTLPLRRRHRRNGPRLHRRLRRRRQRRIRRST